MLNKNMHEFTEEEWFVNYNDIKKEQNERLQLAERIVGDTPIKQIDYIIEHGFNAFQSCYDKYESVSIHREDETKNDSFFAEDVLHGFFKGSADDKMEHSDIEMGIYDLVALRCIAIINKEF